MSVKVTMTLKVSIRSYRQLW